MLYSCLKAKPFMWHSLGTQLGIEESKLLEIQKRPHDKMYAVISMWMDEEDEPNSLQLSSQMWSWIYLR